MRGWLFAVFLIAVVVAVLTTAVGLFVNWGLIETGRESCEELPHLGKLVGGALLGFCGLAIELSRRWFVQSRQPQLYLDLVGAAMVLPTDTAEDVDLLATQLLDYFDQTHGSEEFSGSTREMIEQEIARKKSIRFGGARKVEVVAEVLRQDIA